jgi:hypothetical protein
MTPYAAARDPAVRMLLCVPTPGIGLVSRPADFSARRFCSAPPPIAALSPVRRRPRRPAGSAALKLPTDVSETEKICRWSNWTAYLDYDEETKTYPTLEAFNKESGIQATYSEDIEDNDSYFNKVAPAASPGRTSGADIFTFTDWMANRMIRERLASRWS